MSEKVTTDVIQKTLEEGYEIATNGVIGFESAETLATSYMNTDKDVVSQVNSLIRWQNAKACTVGFITGLGGLITMPVTLPVNIVGVLVLQQRMISAIAHMGGYSLSDDRVKALVFACLLGNGAKDALIKVGEKAAYNLLKNMSVDTMNKINQHVLVKLLAQCTSKGVVNFAKAIPLVGGVVSGTLDSVTTNIVGNVARNTFIVEK